MKKIGKIFTTIAVLLSIVAIFVAGCNFGSSNNTQSGNSGNSGSGGNSSSGGNNNNQQQEELPAPEFESGSGTENDPYIISQPYQWTNISKHLSAYYELGADLNMGDITDLKPVGSDTAPFTGYLDGKNHKVHSATLSTALFGTISEGTVKNLNFADSTINYAIASFADTVKMGATVENCHMTSITMSNTLNTDRALAGLIKTVSSASNVKYCSVNLAWTCGQGDNEVGGLIYQVLGGNIDCCWATGTIKSTVGWNGATFGSFAYQLSNGSITNCYTQYSTNSSYYKVSYMVFDRTGGKMNFCLNINDYTDAHASEWKMFHSSSVAEDSTLKFYGVSTLDSSNDLLDTDEWKDNKLWKKGKLHPELVSYEEYLQITAEK